MIKFNYPLCADSYETMSASEYGEFSFVNDIRARIKRFGKCDAEVWLNERKMTGWIEAIIRVEFESGGSITVGAIQREEGEATEFHS